MKKFVSGIVVLAMLMSIAVAPVSVKAEPTSDTNLYTWPESPAEDTIWSDGLAQNGGSWSNTENVPDFNEAENAILFDADSGYECFSYSIGDTVKKGQIDVSFKFRTNGDRMGVILDSGNGQSDSTVALSTNPWGTWNNGPAGKNLTGQFCYGNFPWNGTALTESNELGQHGDESFGEWLTAEISAKPNTKKYDLIIKNGESEILNKTALNMIGSQIKNIVFVHYDDVDWNSKTYIKDIKVNYTYLWSEPTEDTNFYTWQETSTADTIWSNGLVQNGGSWNSDNCTIDFDDTVKALKFNNPPVKDGWYGDEYFSYRFGGEITNGEINLLFKMKSNGAYFGVILDSGNKDTSTVAMATNPWSDWGGAWNKILNGSFPYDGTELGRSEKFGTRTDDGFGDWLTVEISARPKTQKYDLVITNGESQILNKSDLDMAGTQIKGIVFGHYEETSATWDTTTYVKDIAVDYKTTWSEPTEDTNFYTWQKTLTADTIWSNGLAQNGGSQNGNAVTSVEFDADEKALKLDNTGYEYFNYNFGGKLTGGQIDLSFEFKTNGSYFGIALDSGDKTTSTYALTTHPWGANGGPDGKSLTGCIKYGAFPWGGTVLTDKCHELGQHTADGFGDWLTAEISARPKSQKYDLIVKDGDEVIVYAFDLPMAAAEISGIVFEHWAGTSEITWNGITYVRDIKIDYKTGERTEPTEIYTESFSESKSYVKVEYDTYFSNGVSDIEELHFVQNASGDETEKDITILKLLDNKMFYADQWNELNTEKGTYRIKAVADADTGYFTVELTAPDSKVFKRQRRLSMIGLSAVDKIVIKSDSQDNVSNIKINEVGSDDLLTELSLAEIKFAKDSDSISDLDSVPVDLDTISVYVGTPLFDKSKLDSNIYITQNGVKIACSTEYVGNTFKINLPELDADSEYTLFVGADVAGSDKEFVFKTEKAVSVKIISVKNADGNAVNSVSKASGKLTVESALRNVSGEEQTFKMFGAVYGANGDLIGIKFGKEHKSASDAAFNDEFEFDDLSKAQTIKIFVWNGTDGLKPYGTPITVAEDIFEDGEIERLVTTFIGNAETARGFAWSSASGYNDMAIEYKTANGDWKTTDAVKLGTYNDVQNCWEADLTGLSAGTKYNYRLYDKTADKYTQVYEFETAAENIDSFKFIGVTDSQSGLIAADSDDWKNQYEFFNITVNKAFKNTPDAAFMMQAGDMVNAGSRISMWNNYFKALDGIRETIPHMTTPGNHEYENYEFEGIGDEEAGKAAAYFFNNPDNGKNAIGDLQESTYWKDGDKKALKYIDDTVYSFDYANAHFVVLNTGTDSTAGGSDDLVRAQVDWMKNDLKSSDAKWKIVMLHQGLYMCSGSSTKRDILEGTLEECGVDLVLYGHDHQLMRTYAMKNGSAAECSETGVIEKGSGIVHQMLGYSGAATGGAWKNIPDYVSVIAYSNDPSDDFYTEYSVSENSIDVVVKSVKGTVIDKYSIKDVK